MTFTNGQDAVVIGLYFIIMIIQAFCAIKKMGSHLNLLSKKIIISTPYKRFYGETKGVCWEGGLLYTK